MECFRLELTDVIGWRTTVTLRCRRVINYLPTPIAVKGVLVFTSVCLCLSVFFRTISQKPMQLESPNLT